MKKTFFSFMILCSSLLAHHGVPSLSIAGVEGPGAPLETTSSTTLPEDSFLFYAKLDHAKYKTYTSARDGEGERSEYFMYGLGYGFTSALSAYIFVPYYIKAQDDAFSTSDFHDISIQTVLGFTYDEGFKLTPSSESLDDMEDWHFALSLNITLPTGNSNTTHADGTLIDPGMQSGFGKPTFMLGVSSSKWFGNDFTFVSDVSYNKFLKNSYNDGTTMRFGDELRANVALVYKLFGNSASKLRLDVNMEANYLYLGRDIENGHGADATGGEILYLTPGIRLVYKTSSLAFGVKTPSWTNLNESDDQQGAEGKERYRAIVTFSSLF
ncbi:MAG: transporter [Helicobacteraceae bacterium]|nr:transporter [Helicobacteraceae bacterium]